MQIETINVQQADLINARLIGSEECTGPAKEIDPMALAYLNFGLFKELRKRGTSKERICCVLSLSSDDYDCIVRLG